MAVGHQRWTMASCIGATLSTIIRSKGKQDIWKHYQSYLINITLYNCFSVHSPLMYPRNVNLCVLFSAKNVTVKDSFINTFGFWSWANSLAPAATCMNLQISRQPFPSHKTVASIVLRISTVIICCTLIHVNLRWELLQRWKQLRISKRDFIKLLFI